MKQIKGKWKLAFAVLGAWLLFTPLGAVENGNGGQIRVIGTSSGAAQGSSQDSGNGVVVTVSSTPAQKSVNGWGVHVLIAPPALLRPFAAITAARNWYLYD